MRDGDGIRLKWQNSFTERDLREGAVLIHPDRHSLIVQDQRSSPRSK